MASMLILAACSGSDTAVEETDTATDETVEEVADEPAEEPAEPDAGLSSDDWCNQADSNDGFAIPDLSSAADIEAMATAYLAHIDEAVASAPAEIKSDAKLITTAAKAFFEVFAEYEWDLFSLPPDDERLLAMGDPAIAEAAINIAEYCGWPMDDPAVGTDFGTDPIPADFDESLMPPGNIVFVDDIGPAGVIFGTDADYDDVIAFYTDILGVEPFEGGVDSLVFSATHNGLEYIISASEPIALGAPVYVAVAHF